MVNEGVGRSLCPLYQSLPISVYLHLHLCLFPVCLCALQIHVHPYIRKDCKTNGVRCKRKESERKGRSVNISAIMSPFCLYFLHGTLFLSFCPSAHQSIYLSIYLSICLSICLSVCLSICLSI